MVNLTNIQPIARNVLFPYLTGKDLLRLCQTNHDFAKVCRDDKIWQQRVISDYPSLPDKPKGMSWRNYYLSLINRLITIYYQKEVITLLWLEVDDFFSNFSAKDLHELIAITMQDHVIVNVGSIPNVVDGDYNYIILLNIFQENNEDIRIKIYEEPDDEITGPCRTFDSSTILDYLTFNEIIIPKDTGIELLDPKELCLFVTALQDLHLFVEKDLFAGWQPITANAISRER